MGRLHRWGMWQHQGVQRRGRARREKGHKAGWVTELFAAAIAARPFPPFGAERGKGVVEQAGEGRGGVVRAEEKNRGRESCRWGRAVSDSGWRKEVRRWFGLVCVPGRRTR